ncbi:hypothetical protein Fmac_016101 [Flemingia macrophylla]|uniref:Uncharacterized protein n=1 Tax=Flemingia macrophylla TaxID=520843 RepID=A0ABD1MGF3_9FABA
MVIRWCYCSSVVAPPVMVLLHSCSGCDSPLAPLRVLLSCSSCRTLQLCPLYLFVRSVCFPHYAEFDNFEYLLKTLKTTVNGIRSLLVKEKSSAHGLGSNVEDVDGNDKRKKDIYRLEEFSLNDIVWRQIRLYKNKASDFQKALEVATLAEEGILDFYLGANQIMEGADSCVGQDY